MDLFPVEFPQRVGFGKFLENNPRERFTSLSHFHSWVCLSFILMDISDKMSFGAMIPESIYSRVSATGASQHRFSYNTISSLRETWPTRG
jgi:hypothetical protein